LRYGRVGISILENDAVPGQLVDRRRGLSFIPIGREMFGLTGIDEKDEYVGPFPRRRRGRKRRRPVLPEIMTEDIESTLMGRDLQGTDPGKSEIVAEILSGAGGFQPPGLAPDLPVPGLRLFNDQGTLAAEEKGAFAGRKIFDELFAFPEVVIVACGVPDRVSGGYLRSSSTSREN
jgi:hypothetical protein